MDADYIEGMPLPTGAAHSVSNQGEGGPDPESEVMEKINDIERSLNELQKDPGISDQDRRGVEMAIDGISLLRKMVKVPYARIREKKNPAGFR